MKSTLRVCEAWLACVAPQTGFAQAPVAIVEEVRGRVAGLQAMDYLVPGRSFRLSPNDTVVIGYLTTCVRESIRGGMVEVGKDQSNVRDGVVERIKIECDARDMMAAPGQALDATGTVIRDLAAKEKLPGILRAQPPEFTLYGASPLIELNGSGPLVIARLDAKGEYLKFDVDRKARRNFIDLAASGQSLSPGGVYGARWNKRLVVFRVDPAAKAGAGPLPGRLLRLGFAP